MNKEFIPLTEQQLIAAEKGELKLKYRNGEKVLQIMWCRPPYGQHGSTVLQSIDAKGKGIDSYKDGRYNKNRCHDYDLFIDHEETAKLKQLKEPTPKHKCSYGGQLTGIPDKVVHLMLKRQVEQGNKEDVTVFEEFKYQRKEHGGIDWIETPEKEEYWGDVLLKGNYDIVPDEPEQRTYEVGEIIEVNDCGTMVDAEYRDTKNGKVCVWIDGFYYSFNDGMHRKKQHERTVTIDGKEITVSAAIEYLETLIEKQLDFPEKRVSNGGI